MNNQNNNRPEVLQFCYKIADLIGRQWIARATAIVFIVFIGSFIFSIISPAHGEAFAYNVTIISGILSAGFVGMLAAVGVGVSVNIGAIMIGYGVREARQMNGAQMALPSGDIYDISPDLLVWQRLDETHDQFQQRILDAQKNRPAGMYVVVIAFQDTQIRVDDNTSKGFTTPRNDPEFGFGETPIVAFMDETETQYNNYLRAIAQPLKARLLQDKTEKSNSAFGPILKHSLNVFLFLLLSLSATAQTNTDKVYQFLGSAATQKPKTDEPVVFQFEKDKIIRYGDDKTEIGRMVAQRVGADGADYGQLKAVYRSGSIIPVSGKQQIAATGTNEKPAPLFQTHMEAPHNEAVPQKSFSESLPDSATVANTLNEAKQQLPVYKQVIYKMFKPVWEFAAWLFFFLCPLFGIALGFCNLVSRSARQNGNLGPAVADQQIRFAAAAWWISICVVGSAYICITASMFFWEWNPYVITALCILGYIPAKWAINRLTPNGEYQETITTTRQSGRIGGGNSQRFLNQ